MTDQQKSIFYYFQLPLILMYTAQAAVVMLLIFDRSITLLQGSILIAVALLCVFFRKQTRNMIRKQATLISATELSVAVLLERKGKLDNDLYARLVRYHFDAKEFKRFVSADIDVDKVAKDKNLQTHDDLMKFYMMNLTKIQNI